MCVPTSSSRSETEKEESMENPTTIAIDLSKNVFEIAIERQGRICERKRLNRRQTITFLLQCPKATVLMETCGSSHYFGRVAQGFGHTVKLLPAQHVKPYRIGRSEEHTSELQS